MFSPHSLDRRHFLRLSGTALAATGLAALPRGAVHAQDTPDAPRLKKALKFGMVGGNMSVAEKFLLVKELGFDGIEVDAPSSISRDEFKQASDTSGLPIHGVVDSVHWQQTLSHPDAAVRQAGLDGLKAALQDAKFYGATTVLLVPAVVNKEVSYDEAYERSQAEIRNALPLAAELGVTIALENVWNHFLESPLEAARYIDELDSPYVGAYFDVGNVVNYGWPEQWIRILGRRIVKLDIKEFSRKRRDNEGLWKGFDVPIGEGDCDWAAVMSALRDIDYHGWGTAEVPGGEREVLADIAARMDQVFAA